jgi:hypothetical protein
VAIASANNSKMAECPSSILDNKAIFLNLNVFNYIIDLLQIASERARRVMGIGKSSKIRKHQDKPKTQNVPRINTKIAQTLSQKQFKRRFGIQRDTLSTDSRHWVDYHRSTSC